MPGPGEDLAHEGFEQGALPDTAGSGHGYNSWSAALLQRAEHPMQDSRLRPL